MSKLGEVEVVISDLRSAAAAINEAANTLAALFSAEPNEVPAMPAEPVLTREKVRAILSEKSRFGFTVQVKELLQKYGADRLSAVDPKNYAALVADAEVLGNG